jgi:penicillin-binding protein 2
MIKVTALRQRDEPSQSSVPFLLGFIVVVLFFCFCCAFGTCRLSEVDDYRAMSENNRLRFLPVAASARCIDGS